ncbi:MAG: BON domain-containing protein [Gammaproteobacteria bacterium]|nr:BON domain-containing protein [Gammaproteobacteria bacterium]
MKWMVFPPLLASLLLGGCAAPVVIGLGGAAAGVMVASDRRTAGVMLDDERIEMNTLDLVTRDPTLRDNSHINATCYNGQLLLTGEIPDQRSSELLAERAARLPRVRLVKNELAVGPVTDSATRTRDTATTSRVKSRLLAELGAGLAHHIKVVTENGTVYLMGLLSRDEATQAVAVARRTAGVQRIVKVFEYTP